MSPRFTGSNQNYSSKEFDRGYGYIGLLVYDTLYNILYNICNRMCEQTKIQMAQSINLQTLRHLAQRG